MQAGKVFTVFCGILSAHHSEIPHLRKAQPLHAGWSSLPAQAFDFDGETVIPIGNGNSSAHLTVPCSSHSAHEREQQQFLPWNQSHNPEARGRSDFRRQGWIEGVSREVKNCQGCHQGGTDGTDRARLQSKGNYRGFLTPRSDFSFTTSQKTKIMCLLKLWRKNITLEYKIDKTKTQPTQMCGRAQRRSRGQHPLPRLFTPKA